MILRIATRGSALARWQSAHVAGLLRLAHPDLEIRDVVVQTTGDRMPDVPLFGLGNQGLFTKEVDRAVVDGRAHAAVHSLKDLPTSLEPGLAVAAVLVRADPRDALVSQPGVTLGDLPAGATVGTSSLRRRAQLLNLRPDLKVTQLRGNVDTRVRRVTEGDVDAAILAFAGLQRLGLEAHATELLDPPGWLPAPGQGALAVVVRADDVGTTKLVGVLDDAPSRIATAAERHLLAALEGGCQIPVGALATVVGNELRLCGFVGSPDGRSALRGESDGPCAGGQAIAERLAAELLERGARDILRRVRAETPQPPVPAP